MQPAGCCGASEAAFKTRTLFAEAVYINMDYGPRQTSDMKASKFSVFFSCQEVFSTLHTLNTSNNINETLYELSFGDMLTLL